MGRVGLGMTSRTGKHGCSLLFYIAEDEHKGPLAQKE